MIAPEFVFLSVLSRGFEQLQRNSKVVESLLSDIPPSVRAEMIDYLRHETVAINLNYPRENALLPSINLVLGNEAERETFLGRTMGEGRNIADPETVVEDVATGEEFGAASLSPSDGLGAAMTPRFSPEEPSTSDDPSIVYVPTDITDEDIDQQEFRVVGGTGKGFIARILAVDDGRIQLDTTPAVLFDTTTVAVVRRRVPRGMRAQPPPRMYAENEALEEIGTGERARYTLIIKAKQSNFTILLYQVVKMMLLLNSSWLEENGVHDMVLSGSDLAPDTASFPVPASQRSLIIDFSYFYSFKVPIEVAEAFRDDVARRPDFDEAAELPVATDVAIDLRPKPAT